MITLCLFLSHIFSIIFGAIINHRGVFLKPLQEIFRIVRRFLGEANYDSERKELRIDMNSLKATQYITDEFTIYEEFERLGKAISELKDLRGLIVDVSDAWPAEDTQVWLIENIAKGLKELKSLKRLEIYTSIDLDYAREILNKVLKSLKDLEILVLDTDFLEGVGELPNLRVLDLGGISLNDDEIEVLRRARNNFQKLEYLRLRAKLVKGDGIVRLSEFLVAMRNLRRLSLEVTYYEPSGWSTLIRAIRDLSNIEFLELSIRGRLNSGALRSFSEVLSRIKNLRLSLAPKGKDLPAELISALAGMIKSLGHLEALTLDLSQSEFSQYSTLPRVFEALANLKQLRELRLIIDELGDGESSERGAEALARALKELRNLESLTIDLIDLWRRRYPVELFVGIGEAISGMEKLRRLNLINVLTLENFYESLAHLGSLEELCIDLYWVFYKDIVGDSAKSIAKSMARAIRRLKGLKKLVISLPSVHDGVCIPVIRAISLLHGLRKLSMRAISSAHQAIVFTEILRNFGELRELELGVHGAGYRGITTIARALPNLKELRRLKIDFTIEFPRECEAVRKLLETLPRVPNIRYVRIRYYVPPEMALVIDSPYWEDIEKQLIHKGCYLEFVVHAPTRY